MDAAWASEPDWASGPIRRWAEARAADRGDVRTAALLLLLERPMHGYEMIQEIRERSGEAWSPSPGAIYPTIQLLNDEGLITTHDEDGKKVSSLTEAGRQAAAGACRRPRRRHGTKPRPTPARRAQPPPCHPSSVDGGQAGGHWQAAMPSGYAPPSCSTRRAASLRAARLRRSLNRAIVEATVAWDYHRQPGELYQGRTNVDNRV